jgi:hypothetical protein
LSAFKWVVGADDPRAARLEHPAMPQRTLSRSEEPVRVGAALERDRLQARADRMTAVVRELRCRARFHEERHGRVPAPLNHAVADFVQELRAAERRITELAGRGGRPSEHRTRRFGGSRSTN